MGRVDDGHWLFDLSLDRSIWVWYWKLLLKWYAVFNKDMDIEAQRSLRSSSHWLIDWLFLCVLIVHKYPEPKTTSPKNPDLVGIWENYAECLLFTFLLFYKSVGKTERRSASNCGCHMATMLLLDARSSAVFAGTFVVAYVIWKFVRDTRRRRTSRPPSLWSLPLIGSIMFLPDFRIWPKEFLKMSAKMGNVFAFYMGSQYVSCIPLMLMGGRP